MEMVRELTKLDCTVHRAIMKEVDGLFGEDTCRKVFGDIVPGVQLESCMDSVRQTVEGVSADMPGYGKNIGEGLENGMSDGIKEEKTKGIFSRIGNWFKELFGINSPSKVFAEFGGFLMEGLHKGFREFGRASYKYGSAERQRIGVRLTEVRT